MLCNIPEERRPHLHRVEGVKSRIFIMHNIHHILSTCITHITIITVFHTHVADRMTGMLVMYGSHRILPELKIQVSCDVKLSISDKLLVTSLMGSSSRSSRPAKRTWPAGNAAFRPNLRKRRGVGWDGVGGAYDKAFHKSLPVIPGC